MFKIKNEFHGARISRTVRFTENLYNQLNDLAHENKISFNLLVLKCCKYALNEQDTNWNS